MCADTENLVSSNNNHIRCIIRFMKQKSPGISPDFILIILVSQALLAKL